MIDQICIYAWHLAASFSERRGMGEDGKAGHVLHEQHSDGV